MSAYFLQKSLGVISEIDMYLLSLSLADQLTTSGGCPRNIANKL